MERSSLPPVRRFSLSHRSALPDPAINAYRDDLADVALAGAVIASHYAEPVIRRCRTAVALNVAAARTSQVLEWLDEGTSFALLDCAQGRGWGYAVATHRVGYVDEDALD